MRAGISTATLFLRLNTEDAAALYSEWGVNEAEIFLNSFSEYEAGFARLLKEKKGEMRVHSVHALGTQFEPQLFSDHPRVRADAYFWLGKFLSSAKELGARYYTFHGPTRAKRTMREDIPKTGKYLSDICAFCKKYGVTLSLENVEWAFYNRPGVFRALKEYCPDLKAVLDIKQARLSGYDYRDYLKEMGRDLTHVHVSDITADGRMCLPGQGTFDFDGLFSLLADAGFTGSVILENYAKDFKDLGELKAAYEFLKEKAEKY